MQSDLSSSTDITQPNVRRVNKQYLFNDFDSYRVSRATRIRHKNKLRQLRQKSFDPGNILRAF